MGMRCGHYLLSSHHVTSTQVYWLNTSAEHLNLKFLRLSVDGPNWCSLVCQAIYKTFLTAFLNTLPVDSNIIIHMLLHAYIEGRWTPSIDKFKYRMWHFISSSKDHAIQVYIGREAKVGFPQSK